MTPPHIHVPYEKIGEHLPFIRQQRLNLEIYFTSPVLDSLEPGAIDRLREELDYGPSLSFHAPFMDLSPGAMDSKVRTATMERFSHILDIASVLRPLSIVFHSGYEKWKYGLKIGPWLEQSLLTWRPINTRAEDLGVKVAIENIFEDEPSNLRMLMEEMGSDNFGVCFDAGHFNLFSGIPLKDWIGELLPHIIELHLHDNDRTADQHNPIGEGCFDFPGLFSLLKEKSCIHTIEARSPEMAILSMQRLKIHTEQGHP
ncbi:MAG: sugar phosphate isomerase/epimerase family protein [Thermodesulfovibrionales bacterium]|jgi:sugar phosphate isomerase/epimerase